MEEPEVRPDPVFEWRRCVLEAAGFHRTDAGALAARNDVDLHGAVDLVRSGCPPEIAFLILD